MLKQFVTCSSIYFNIAGSRPETKKHKYCTELAQSLPFIVARAWRHCEKQTSFHLSITKTSVALSL